MSDGIDDHVQGVSHQAGAHSDPPHHEPPVPSAPVGLAVEPFSVHPAVGCKVIGTLNIVELDPLYDKGGSMTT